MRNRVNKINQLKNMFINNNGVVYKEEACFKLGISKITLARYIESLRSNGMNIVSKRNFYQAADYNDFSIEKPFSKAQYVSLKILMYIYNNDKCSRRELIDFFCKKDQDDKSLDKMTLRNLDIHIKHLLKEQMIEKHIINRKVYYRPHKSIMERQMLKYDECFKILFYIKMCKPYLPFHFMIKSIEEKLYSAMLHSIGKYDVDIDDVRFMEKTVSTIASEIKNDEKDYRYVQILYNYCKRSTMLKVQLVNGVNYRIIPLRVLYNWEKNKWYMACYNVKARNGLLLIKIDKIKEVILLEGSHIIESNRLRDIQKELDYKLQNSFAISFEQGIQVEVIFLNQFNVVEKARNKLIDKQGEVKILEDGSLYYCGQIHGAMDFLYWLRRFGSSVVILSPDWLQKKHIQSACKSLDNYGVEYE